MSAEFHIPDGSWSVRRLRTFAEEWVPKAPVPLLFAQPWTRGAKGPGTWFFGEGSIRGCSLQLDADLLKTRSLRVRLNAMASRADWQIGHALLRALVEAGGGTVTGPDGERVPPDELQEPAASNTAMARLRDDAEELAKALHQDGTYAALPNPLFSLIVTAELLPAEDDPTNFALALEEELALMAARYIGAEVVDLVTLPDGSSFSMWARQDALAFAAHFFGVGSPSEEDEAVVLPGPRLLELMGDRLEVVSEEQDRFYLPALDPADPEDAAMLEAVEAEGQPLQAWLAQYPT